MKDYDDVDDEETWRDYTVVALRIRESVPAHFLCCMLYLNGFGVFVCIDRPNNIHISISLLLISIHRDK